MIKGLLRRAGAGSSDGPPSDGAGPSVEELQAQVRRLEQQNERLRKAMRHCTDCEYRIEVVARRDQSGVSAGGRELLEPSPPLEP